MRRIGDDIPSVIFKIMGGNLIRETLINYGTNVPPNQGTAALAGGRFPRPLHP